MIKARYFTKLDDKIRCELCPHLCELKENQKGICNVRKNEGGELVVLNYSRLVSLSMDPIEKKPLYHFYPGEKILSAASYGCNFQCRWCQNWSISQKVPSYKKMEPQELVEYVEKKSVDMIAFTYSEPLMWFEYIYDFAEKIKNKNSDFKIVLVTNGYINKKPLSDLVEYIDAANIDIKGMQDDIYKKYIGGKLLPVLETVKYLYENGVHIEITDLLVTDLNDKKEDVVKLVNWIKTNLDSSVPLHLSKYYPTYKMNNPETPKNNMEKAFKIANEKLNNVYIGNTLIKEDQDNTYCSNCNNLLINRVHYTTEVVGLDKQGRCKKCGKKLNIQI